MTAPDRNRQREARTLARYRDLADRLAGDEWIMESDSGGMAVRARRFDGSEDVIADLTLEASRDEITLLTEGPQAIVFLVGLVDRAARTIREMRATSAPPAATADPRDKPEDDGAQGARPAKDYAAQAAMLLPKEAFQHFLTDQRHGEIIDTPAAADAAIKALLGITSKRQLNAEAAGAWRDLMAGYESWNRGIGR